MGKVIVSNTRKIAYVDDYDFWKKYYNDDRFGRTWEFKISQKYDTSKLHKYDPVVVVVQKDVGLPGEMGNWTNYCTKSIYFLFIPLKFVGMCRNCCKISTPKKGPRTQIH